MAATLLILVLYVVAVTRVTRVVVVDKIGEPVRSWAIDRFGEDGMLTYLVHCTACVSIWAGFALAPAAVALTGLTWWLLPFVALFASQVAIYLSRLDIA